MITKYFSFAKLLAQQHAENLAADPMLARRLDKDERARVAAAENLIDLAVEQESYTDCNGKKQWRPKGEGERQRIANRVMDNAKFRAHTQAVYEDVQSRRIDELDPDWRDRMTFEQADNFYRLELNKLTDDSGVTFDDGLTDDDAR